MQLEFVSRRAHHALLPVLSLARAACSSSRTDGATSLRLASLPPSQTLCCRMFSVQRVDKGGTRRAMTSAFEVRGTVAVTSTYPVDWDNGGSSETGSTSAMKRDASAASSLILPTASSGADREKKKHANKSHVKE